jgi:hypothetical protein
MRVRDWKPAGRFRGQAGDRPAGEDLHSVENLLNLFSKISKVKM